MAKTNYAACIALLTGMVGLSTAGLAADAQRSPGVSYIGDSDLPVRHVPDAVSKAIQSEDRYYQDSRAARCAG